MKTIFLGDISLNDQYISLSQMGIDPFLCLGSILQQTDFVFGNLECMVKGNCGENSSKKPRLSTNLETLNYLKSLRLKLVFLAHNHVFDHLDCGFERTTDFLRVNNIQYIGAGLSEEEAKKDVIFENNEIKIGILNYVTLDTNPNLPENASIFINTFNQEAAIKDIKRLKEIVNHVILSLHWGGRVEGGLFPDYYQNKLAKTLIDNGADLIIGHHSHTFQPFEIYKGKYIFYSLGNFCFSDYEFEGRIYSIPKRSEITSILEIAFNKESYKINLHFFKNNIDSFLPLHNYLQRTQFINLLYKYFFRFRLPWTLYYLYKKNILPIIQLISLRDQSFMVKLNRIKKAVIKRIF